MTLLPRLLQAALFATLVRPFVRLFLSPSIENGPGLPRRGPAVIVANHNSHLDTLALMSLIPLRDLWTVRPVGAADHFGGAGLVGWLARRVLRTILVERDGRGPEAALEPVLDALDRGEILIFYPEGTRGEPERLGRFKRGIAVLAAERPKVSIVPVGLRGLGKCLPKGGSLPVPFSCTVAVGEAEDLQRIPNADLPDRLRARVEALSRRSPLCGWGEESGHGLGDAAVPLQQGLTAPATAGIRRRRR